MLSGDEKMGTSLPFALERRNKTWSPMSHILGDKRTWLLSRNFASCRGLITQGLNQKRRAGPVPPGCGFRSSGRYKLGLISPGPPERNLGILVKAVTHEKYQLFALAFSRGASRLVTGGSASRIRAWDGNGIRRWRIAAPYGKPRAKYGAGFWGTLWSRQILRSRPVRSRPICRPRFPQPPLYLRF